MRILVLNGSPKKKSDTFRLTDAFLKVLAAGRRALRDPGRPERYFGCIPGR